MKSPASTVVVMLLATCSPLSSSIESVSLTFDLSTISTSVAVADPILRPIASAFFLASDFCECDSSLNWFHVENGGFLSFFSTRLSSPSIDGLSPALAEISKNSQLAVTSACDSPAGPASAGVRVPAAPRAINAETMATGTQRRPVICPPQYLQG